MASANIINIKNAHVRFADTEAGLTAAADFQCQVNSAAINANPSLQTVPATFCAPESQMPAATGWELVLTWLQDWGVPSSVGPPATGSLSQFMFDNDATLQWFSIEPVDVALADVPMASGQCWIVAGAYLGDAGTPLQATANCPLPQKPTLAPAAGGLEAEAAPTDTTTDTATTPTGSPTYEDAVA